MSEPIRLPASTVGSNAAIVRELPVPDLQLKVELDERCFLFPAAKNLSHVLLLVYLGDKLRIDFAFPYNANQTATEFLELKAASVTDLARKLVEAVYRAGSFLLIEDGVNIAFMTHPNGYVLQIGDFVSQREAFISAQCIWRFCGAVCRAADSITVPKSH